MRKGDYCIRSIDKLVYEGCISLERAAELKKWQEYRKEHPEISGLSEGACKLLMRETNPVAEAAVLESIRKDANKSKAPTAAQIATQMDNARAGKSNQGGDHKGASKAEDKPGVELGDFVKPIEPDNVEPDPEEACPYVSEEDGEPGNIPVLPDEEEGALGVTPEPVMPTPDDDEEEEEDNEETHPETPKNVIKERLRNAGHEDPKPKPKPKPRPTEENKQAIFDKCVLQALVWGMEGDEIARRMRKAITYVDTNQVEKLKSRLGDEN